MDDSALLRRYAEDRSDEAFAILVARHINLVYSVALRCVSNPENAQEITQAVFIILAKKAASLRHDKALSSWLFQTTRLTAANFIRSESRRNLREQEAYMQSRLNDPGDDVWPKLAPLLDGAVANLREKDRRAILLRFYEGKNLREVGLALGASEDAAEKRVLRALDKMRVFFSKQGVTSSAASIAGMISTHSIQTAPAALVKSASIIAAGKGAAASVPILTLVKGAINATAWTNAKTSIAVAGAILLAAGTTALLVQRASLASIDGTYRSILFKHEYQLYAKRFEGVWEGKLAIMLNSSGKSLYHRIVVKVVQTDGSYHAVIDEIDAGLKNVLAPRLTLDKLAMNFASDFFWYHGVFHKDATEIRGVWRSAEGSYLLVLERTNAPDAVQPPLAREDYTPRPRSDIQGLWKCVVTNNSSPQRLYVKFAESANGALRGEWNNIDKPPVVPVPVTISNYIDPHLHFLVDSIGDSFIGDLTNNNTSLPGVMKQSSTFATTKASRMVFNRVNPDDEMQALQADKNFDYASDAEVTGHWNGVFPPALGVALNLTLNIARLPDGTLSATLDSPDQFLSEIPVEVFEFKSSKVRMEMKGAHCAFEGKLTNGKLAGTWSFYDASAPIQFERRKP